MSRSRVTPAIAYKIRFARNVNREPLLKLAMKYNLSVKHVSAIATGRIKCEWEPDAWTEGDHRLVRAEARRIP